ncbi:MAG: hypothetical protein LH609_19215 [Rudanella sp.]|nr:hypothetical protein [Rudanella sp.]
MVANRRQLTCQKDKFSLPADIHYLNCATRRPFSRAVEEAGVAAISRQTNPFSLTATHFFEQPMRVRQLFSGLISNRNSETQGSGTVDPDRIAVVPSVSYAMGVVARNLHRKRGALVCVGYKWLMGPYSTGLAYFGEAFDEGIPLEETWMARVNSEQFHRLTEYQPMYRPKAYRYNVGEQSHFIHMPMLEASLDQLTHWKPETIQAYARDLMADALTDLEAVGCRVEDAPWRSHHLLGLWLPNTAHPVAVQQALLARKVSVSVRGRALRVSPNVYNDQNDVDAFVAVLKESL